jgi:hypothetical protein
MIKTKEQLDSVIEVLNKVSEQFHKKMTEHKVDAYNEYASNNNPYHRGDIIWDNDNRILITHIKVYPYFEKYPYCVYIGTKLKKNNEKYKSGQTAEIFQGRIKGFIVAKKE